MRIFLFAIAIMMSGCAGYQVGPIKPTPMKNVQRICVQNFKNDTLEPRVEVLLTNAVIKQIQQDGTYEVTDEAHADVILTGTLNELIRRPARSFRSNILQTREYQLYLRGRFTVTNINTGVVLENRPFTGTTSFFVTGSSPIAADSNQDERQAIPLAAEDMAVRMVSQISEGW